MKSEPETFRFGFFAIMLINNAIMLINNKINHENKRKKCYLLKFILIFSIFNEENYILG